MRLLPVLVYILSQLVPYWDTALPNAKRLGARRAKPICPLGSTFFNEPNPSFNLGPSLAVFADAVPLHTYTCP